ncbi:MAG: hypothetical protein CMB56_007470 [Methanobacteriota archaeon]|nr:MAG: hypothetical protein CMB56_007470 [Euryarchaeota archaeon]|tara:strand:- start:7047 stop:8024 length:978 start_codon:yes stop_codon:yes gene_type:complete
MFNAIVEEEEEKSEVVIDDDKSKELKDKLAQSIEDFSSELKEKLSQSLEEISSAPEKVKIKKPIWSLNLFGKAISVSLLFSALLSIIVYFNAILGIFPGGLLGESNFGDKFYYYVFFEKLIGTYPESSSAVRPTWEFAGSISLQDVILLALSGLFLFLTFIKLQIRGFKLFSQGVAVENASEGTDEIFKSSKILVFLTLLMYILTVIGAVVIDNRFEDSETVTLVGDESHLVKLDSVHTISWQTKVIESGENSSYSVLFLDSFNCEKFEDKLSFTESEMLSKTDLNKSSFFDPKRVSRDNYCIAITSTNSTTEFPMVVKYLIEAS